MMRLELVMGLSYSASGVNCKKGEPFEVSDEVATKLMATGRFATVREAVDEAPPADHPVNESGNLPVNVDGESGQQTDFQTAVEDPLSADKVMHMKKDALIALATEKGIDIYECNNNDERAKKICGVLGLASTVQFGIE